MAVGSIVSGLSSIAAAEYLSIQPSGTDEWVIHSIFHEYNVDLEFYDGTNAITFDTDIGAGVYARLAFHVTNARYLRIENKHAADAKLIGYDGVQTK